MFEKEIGICLKRISALLFFCMSFFTYAQNNVSQNRIYYSVLGIEHDIKPVCIYQYGSFSDVIDVNLYGSVSKKQAFNSIKKLADSGDDVSCCAIGICYRKGLGTKIDIDKALQYYQKASNRGFAPAMNALGYLYFEGTSIKQDFYKAFAFFKQSAQKNYPCAYFNLAKCYQEGLGIEKNRLESLKCLEIAAASNNSDYLYELGERYFENGDFTNAEKYLQKASELNNLSAMSRLAQLYSPGIGYAQPGEKCDKEKYLYWKKRYCSQSASYRNSEYEKYVKLLPLLEKRASGGETDVFYDLSYIYAPYSVLPNLEKYIFYLTKASDSGNDAALYALASAYLDGKGVKVDKAFALLLLKKISMDSEIRTNYFYESTLKNIYINSLTGVSDYLNYFSKQNDSWKYYVSDFADFSDIPKKEAFQYFYERASDSKLEKEDIDEAELILAFCYKKGLGVKQDDRLAKRYGYVDLPAGVKIKTETELKNELQICVDEQNRKREDLKKRASSGNYLDQFQYAEFLYNHSRCTVEDAKEAFLWMEKASKANYNEAIMELGNFYKCGIGVQSDRRKAFECFVSAAKLGSAKAMNILGERYLTGDGTGFDFDKASEYFLKAYENGDRMSQYMLESLCITFNVSNSFTDTSSWTKKYGKDIVVSKINSSDYLNADRTSLSETLALFFSSYLAQTDDWQKLIYLGDDDFETVKGYYNELYEEFYGLIELCEIHIFPESLQGSSEFCCVEIGLSGYVQGEMESGTDEVGLYRDEKGMWYVASLPQ